MTDYDDMQKFLKVTVSVMILFLIVSVVGLCVQEYHSLYVRPDIEFEADKECKLTGFDTFESYTTKGIYPTDYVLVKCKFVGNRMDLQGDININK